ncbi:MAG: SRPBCC family protein [Ornithinimicrobium sp.]|uniref:SRPBCC family protein n=1 Tax=Ornithinimicrobium sp. TaxID=1977084 RepID=UPI003D9BCEAA
MVGEVFAAWSDAAGWSRWWWPHWENTRYEVDFREGGHYRVESPSGGVGVLGTFTRIDEPHSIEMTWVWLDEPGEQAPTGPEETVRVDFTAQDGTLVTVTHRVAGAPAADGYREGWTFVLGNLAATLAVDLPHPQQAHLDRLHGPVARVDVTIDAPPGALYAAWLDPTQLAGWWWPQWPDTTYEVDAQVGGRFRFRSGTAGFGAHGTYLDLDDPAALVMMWIWETGERDSPEDLVTVTFTDVSGPGTEGLVTYLVLEHQMATPTENFRQVERSWSALIGRLTRWVAEATSTRV